MCVQVVSLQYEACYNFTLRIENAHGFSLPTYSAEQACTHRKSHSPLHSSPTLTMKHISIFLWGGDKRCAYTKDVLSPLIGEVSAQPPVLDSSQSRAQFVTVASGAASGVIGFVLIVVVGTMVVVALATRTRVTKTGDHCL